MFDTEFREADDAALLAAVEKYAAAEAAAAARRLAAVAELTVRRCGDDERAHWACDDWDAAAAEISATLGIGHGRASNQMHLAIALRLRLPKVAALFLAGKLSARLVAAIAWRTALVTESEPMAVIDDALARHADQWEALSQYKLEQAIDTWIDRHDPGALRRTQSSARSRDVTIGGQNHEAGTAELWGRLYATDAAALERRLTQMAHAVCEDDPRIIGQRRADALGALAAGSETLACQCGGPQCPSAGRDARAGNVVIHVLADAEAMNAEPGPGMSGEPDSAKEQPAQERSAPPTGKPGSAIIVGGGVLPTPLLAELIRSGAKVKNLRRPPDLAEPRYRPSTALDEFVRMRDLTCRFPNCDKPAEYCDIDHTVPWPLGPTHPSNLACLCRKHHLLKTFWGGRGGWTNRQLPDGSVIWTSPAGKRYTTLPGSRLLFPAWDSTTTTVVPAAAGQPSGDRGLMMPTRRRTRAQDLKYRIKFERALNDEHVAERNQPPPY